VTTRPRYLIKFQQGDLASLRERLLADHSREHFAVLLGKTRTVGGLTIMTVIDQLFPAPADYQQQSIAHLQMNKAFIHRILAELTQRYDVDTLIDVHTHPFTHTRVSFSATDDEDERRFFQFLTGTFAGICYASVVFSQTRYAARVWTHKGGSLLARKAVIKTQTSPENMDSAETGRSSEKHSTHMALHAESGFFHRSALALGLDVMRVIMDGQRISLVGVGGLGSVIAEHLIHMGFHSIDLIDPDTLEMANLNRVVGASYEDAERQRPKVEVIRKHLLRINPHATVRAYQRDIHDQTLEPELALSDWIIVATDTHASRLRAQELSLKYFVPLISVGVNLSVKNGDIEDMSGEVITARVGDALCLQCLGRINPIRVASERHPDQAIREALVMRGYISGAAVKEPAVKTLNTFLATMAVDVLINQYTQAHKHVPILVYEQNGSMSIYEDNESLQKRNRRCFLCTL
jgi:molybdopterin/thiamine biosynthesis adenylyltransferase